jgi:hypothetical protein
MSILEEVNDLCRRGELFRLLPPIASPLPQRGRLLYVSSEIQNWLIGPWPDEGQEYRWKVLRADLEAFVEGKRMTLSRNRQLAPRTHCHLAQLKRPAEEVWEFRLRRPKPSIRVFGRFAARDFFVALTWTYRLDLGPQGSEVWDSEKQRCVAEWRRLFFGATYQPLTNGSYPDDYISNYYLI